MYNYKKKFIIMMLYNITKKLLLPLVFFIFNTKNSVSIFFFKNFKNFDCEINLSGRIVLKSDIINVISDIADLIPRYSE